MLRWAYTASVQPNEAKRNLSMKQGQYEGGNLLFKLEVERANWNGAQFVLNAADIGMTVDCPRLAVTAQGLGVRRMEIDVFSALADFGRVAAVLLLAASILAGIVAIQAWLDRNDKGR